MSKRTPEYESLRTQLHGICSSLSSQPATLVPLVTDLAGIKIISQSTMNALVGVRGIPPYEQAAQLLSSVHVSVQFDAQKLYIFADKLIDHEHEGIAIELLKECEKRGGKQVPELPQSVPVPDNADNPLLQQTPTLQLFYKHIVNVNLHYKWPEIGILLGVPKLKLQSLQASNSDSSTAILDIFDSWEKTDQVEFTWNSLFKELNNSTIDKDVLAQLKLKIIEELTKS